MRIALICACALLRPRSRLANWLVAVVLLTVLTVLTGCQAPTEEHPPIPEVAIALLDAPGRYRIDGLTVDRAGLAARLQAIADKNRRERSGTVRAHVRISRTPGTPFDRVQEVIDLCNRAGLDKVVLADRLAAP